MEVSDSVISRGFVTIATGREEYYILAHNLLMSYRFHSRSQVPFAVICDKENEYTADFDKVVLMDNPKYSVFDKLRLPELAPYDETIFIEADCLVYADLNGMWDLFKDGPDFGGLGIPLSLDDERGWIRPEFLGKFTGLVKEQCLHQGGVSFMRKGNLKDFMLTCEDIYLHLDDFHFGLPNEEPIIILACMVHGYKPVMDWFDVFCYYPVCAITMIDILDGVLEFNQKPNGPNSRPGIFLVHWGTKYTREKLYQREAQAVVSQMRLRGLAKLAAFCAYKVKLLNYNSLKRKIPLPVKTFVWKILVLFNRSLRQS